MNQALADTLEAQSTQTPTRAEELKSVLDGTTIYAVGSLGRLEVRDDSDLDVFVLSGTASHPTLGRLQEHELIADLIGVARQIGFPRFSREGEFLSNHAFGDVVGQVGEPDDDYFNRFTARMLLLLESRWLYHETTWRSAVDGVIDRYWHEVRQHQLSVFLVNDLVRYWKTLCLNYEAARRRRDEAIATKRLALLKLRYNRMWTCFSGLSYLLHHAAAETISRTVVGQMVQLSPAERFVDVACHSADASNDVQELLAGYAAFVAFCDRDADEINAALESDKRWDAERAASKEFGQAMHRLISRLAANRPIERFLIT